MKIKTKILIIVAVFTLGLFLSGGVFNSLLFFDMLNKQERLDILNKSRNLVSYIQVQNLSLKSTLNDWAKWDDSYAFVSDHNQDYIDLNLTAESVYNLNISFMAYYDMNGQEVYKLYFDREKDTLVDFPPVLAQSIGQDIDRTFSYKMQYSDETDILRCGSDTYLIARTSVTDSAESKDPAGIMLIGRNFDAGMMQKMDDLAEGNTVLLQYSSIDPQTLYKLTAQPEERGVQVLSIAQDARTMNTYVMVAINGRFTGTVIQLTDSRDIYRAGLGQHNLIMLTFFILTVLIILVLLRTLDVFITKPLVSLVRAIARIAPSENSSRRLEVKGRGELALLSGSINRMLDNIEENFKEIDKREEQFSSLVGEMKQGFALFEIIRDAEGRIPDCRCLYANGSFRQITGLDSMDLTGKSILDMFPQTGRYWLERYANLALADGSVHIEESFKESGRYMEISAYRPQPMQCAVLLTDITERRLIEEEREYASYHDRLTGLYNRRYFEEALHLADVPENYPLSVIIGDLNGLKFTNDAFGHETGDRLLVAVADIIRQQCREKDIIARWGGDEFTLLLPGASMSDVSMLCARIRENVAKLVINSTNYTISFGYETKSASDEDIDALLKRAEDYMYRRKMTENLTGRGNAIQTILTTFQEKNEREKEHSGRVSRLCRLISEAMGFTEEQAADMEITGLVHDIGKIAIRDSVLNKKGMLNEEEWAEMKKHPEIGCRILCASNEMIEIADYILAHHERFDGSGYPKGLAGREIPLQARILAVADSYDAITSMRPYKLKLGVKDAVAELKRCAGIQFDPAVVRAFVEGVLGFGWDGAGIAESEAFEKVADAV